MVKPQKKKIFTKMAATAMAASLVFGGGGMQAFASSSIGPHDMGDNTTAYASVGYESRTADSATSSSVISGSGTASTYVKLYWWLGQKKGSVTSKTNNVAVSGGVQAAGAIAVKNNGGAEITKAEGYHWFSASNGNVWGSSSAPRKTTIAK